MEVQPVKPSRPHSTVACGYTDMRSGVFWGCIQSQTWLILNDGSSSTAECTLTFCDRRLLTDDTGRHPSLRLEARQRQKRFISVRITSLFRTTWYIMFAYDTCSDFQPTKIEWGRDRLSQFGYCVILWTIHNSRTVLWRNYSCFFTLCPFSPKGLLFKPFWMIPTSLLWKRKWKVSCWDLCQCYTHRYLLKCIWCPLNWPLDFTLN